MPKSSIHPEWSVDTPIYCDGKLLCLIDYLIKNYAKQLCKDYNFKYNFKCYSLCFCTSNFIQ